MLPKHARPGIAHYGLHLIAPLGLITVDGAIRTGRLGFTKAAPFQSQSGVIQESLAVRAKAAGVVMASAVAAHHGYHRMLFAREVFAPGLASRDGLGFGKRLKRVCAP